MIQPSRHSESGNILFVILMAIVLIGALTAAIQFSTRPEGNNIDRETLVIRATEVQRYTAEIERGVRFMQQNGISENAIRFSHYDAPADYGNTFDPTPSNNEHQMFHPRGGGAEYRQPPEDITIGTPNWEFYGGTALPQVGTSASDLVAVLPNVTAQFCAKINDINDLTGQPADPGTGTVSDTNAGGCVYMGDDGRFNDTRQFYATPNTPTAGSFSTLPALQGCVQCATDGTSTEDEYHFYHVILSR